MYIKIFKDEPIPYTLGQLIVENPNTSFPEYIPESLLKDFDVFPVLEQLKPDFNERTQKLEYSYKELKGSWYKVWVVLDKTPVEIESWVESKANEVRQLRNKLIGDTDFYALSDNVMSPEMAEYRQELRNITLQRGFPEDILWPTKPA